MFSLAAAAAALFLKSREGISLIPPQLSTREGISLITPKLSPAPTPSELAGAALYQAGARSSDIPVVVQDRTTNVRNLIAPFIAQEVHRKFSRGPGSMLKRAEAAGYSWSANTGWTR